MASLSIDDEYTNDLPVANNSGFDQAYFLPAHAYKGNLQWAPRIRFHPTIMKPISKVIISTDGVKIYAEAIGDPSKPALVLIPGYSLSTIVFEKQFSDANLYKDVYLVRRLHSIMSVPLLTRDVHGRLDMTLEVMEGATSQIQRTPTPQRFIAMILWLFARNSV